MGRYAFCKLPSSRINFKKKDYFSLSMKRRTKTILEILGGIIIIAFLLTKINLQEVWNITQQLNLSFFFTTAVPLYIITLFLTSYSLKALFNSVKNIPFKEWARYYFIGFSMGLILPGRAGDLSVIYFMKKKGFQIGESTALTIIDKAITLTIFGTIGAIGLLTILEAEQTIYGIIAAATIVAGGLFTFTKAGRTLIKKAIGKYAGTFQGFHKAAKNLLKNHKDKLAINIFITLIRPISNGLLIVLILSALGYNTTLLFAILISSITLIASLAPFTPNGLGVREGVGAYLFYQVGIPLEVSVSMYLIILLLNYSTGVSGVIYYLWKKRHNS